MVEKIGKTDAIQSGRRVKDKDPADVNQALSWLVQGAHKWTTKLPAGSEVIGAIKLMQGEEFLSRCLLVKSRAGKLSLYGEDISHYRGTHDSFVKLGDFGEAVTGDPKKTLRDAPGHEQFKTIKGGKVTGYHAVLQQGREGQAIQLTKPNSNTILTFDGVPHPPPPIVEIMPPPITEGGGTRPRRKIP